MPLPAPDLSIVTVVLNDPAGLEATARSVAEQDFPGCEFIVIDGASGPGTQEVLARFRETITVLVSEPDQGLYDAMNKGLRLARGTWIQFLNAGDTFVSSCSLAVFMAEAHPESDVLYGDHTACYPGWRRPMEAVDPDILPYRGFACHQALLVRTALARQIGGFREAFHPSADYDFTCRLFALGPNHQHMHQDFIAYQSGGLSETHAVDCRLQEWRISRAHFGPSPKRDLYFLLRLVSALANAVLRKMGATGASTLVRRLLHALRRRPAAQSIEDAGHPQP